jgi:Tfp pilus assembly protein PilO
MAEETLTAGDVEGANESGWWTLIKVAFVIGLCWWMWSDHQEKLARQSDIEARSIDAYNKATQCQSNLEELESRVSDLESNR